MSYAVYENSKWVGKGISFDILNILQSELEFEYSIVLPEDNILGSNRSGIFGQMYHHVSTNYTFVTFPDNDEVLFI